MPFPRCYYIVIFIFLMLLLSSVPALGDRILYQTDFSDAEGWETNSPSSYYLDEASNRYSYLIEKGTGSYAYYELPTPYTGPFTLEFEVHPVKTDEKSSFRFGIGKDDLDSQKGPLVLAELYNQNGENLFALTAISKENLRSQTFSMPGKGNYQGNTVKFSDGMKYRIRLTWYPVEKRVSMTVTNPEDDSLLFSHFVTVTGTMESFTHLFLTSIGEGQSRMIAEGYIDSISLIDPASVMAEPRETKTASITPSPSPTLIVRSTPTDIETTPATSAPEPVRTPLPGPPEPTQTPQAGLLQATAVIALVGCLLLIRRV